jgi:hypothetical protein
MTEPNPSNPNGGRRRQSTAAERQERQLQELVRLAGSVEQLAGITPRQAEPPEPPTPDVRRLLFAYTLLGVQLGRRDPGFEVRRVTVEEAEDAGQKQLRFTQLPNEDLHPAALVRARDGTLDVLEELVEGQAQDLSEDIEDKRIDEIVILDAPRGVPLAIACLPQQGLPRG